jgi:hypothetical protein
MAAWCSSQAYTDNGVVAIDLQRAITDVGNGQYGTAAIDGETLEAAAFKVGEDPLPPVSGHLKVEYGLYFFALGIEGKDLATGDVTSAENEAAMVVKYKGAVQDVDAQCTALGD